MARTRRPASGPTARRGGDAALRGLLDEVRGRQPQHWSSQGAELTVLAAPLYWP